MVRAVPKSFRTVTPHLTIEGASDAIKFYKKAFGAKEMGRMMGPDGKRIMHAMIMIGNSVIMLNDDFPEWGSKGPKGLGGTPITVHLYVEDADKAFKKAVKAGATVAMPLADMFWGDRYGMLTDPFGHRWSIATHKKDLTRAQMAKAAKAAMAEHQAPGAK
jgi:PhnB protein